MTLTSVECIKVILISIKIYIGLYILCFCCLNVKISKGQIDDLDVFLCVSTIYCLFCVSTEDNLFVYGAVTSNCFIKCVCSVLSSPFLLFSH